MTNILKKYEHVINTTDFKQKIIEEKNRRKLNISREELTELVVPTIKIEKGCCNEIESNYEDRKKEYSSEYLLNLWKERTNVPYKNIIKNNDYSKTIKSKDDLVIYKTTDKDKNDIQLLTEYNKLKQLIEAHNIELGKIFSEAELLKHKADFDNINRYNNRLHYNPKDYNELKELYDNEQKKINEESTRIDMIMASILDTVKNESEQSVIKIDDTVRNKYKNKNK